MVRWRYFGALVVFATVGPWSAGGCANTTPDCGSLCLDNAPECSNSCDATYSACYAKGASAYFQLYVTCLSNAGSSASAADDCTGIAKTVQSVCGSTIDIGSDSGGGVDSGVVVGDSGATGSGGGGGGGGGGSSGDASAASCESASCESVCADYGTGEENCVTGCTSAEAACSEDAAQFEAVLECLCQSGGFAGSTQPPAACEQSVLALEQDCGSVTTPPGGSGGVGFVVDVARAK
jgi:hypothetical protein